MTPVNALSIFSMRVNDFLGKQSVKWPVQSSKQIRFDPETEWAVAGLL